MGEEETVTPCNVHREMRVCADKEPYTVAWVVSEACSSARITQDNTARNEPVIYIS